MGNAGARVGIGILSNVKVGAVGKLALHEMTRKVKGGGVGQVWGELNLVRTGLEHLVRMFRTEPEGLSALSSTNIAGKYASNDEGGSEEAAHGRSRESLD